MKWLFYTNINKKKHKIVKTKSLFVIKKNNANEMKIVNN